MREPAKNFWYSRRAERAWCYIVERLMVEKQRWQLLVQSNNNHNANLLLWKNMEDREYIEFNNNVDMFDSGCQLAFGGSCSILASSNNLCVHCPTCRFRKPLGYYRVERQWKTRVLSTTLVWDNTLVKVLGFSHCCTQNPWNLPKKNVFGLVFKLSFWNSKFKILSEPWKQKTTQNFEFESRKQKTSFVFSSYEFRISVLVL